MSLTLSMSSVAALELTEQRASEDDEAGQLPRERFDALAAAGLLQPPQTLLAEMQVLRGLARIHGSLARVLDGHYNAIERLTLAQLPEEPESIASGEMLLGVWGADPVGREGEPARLAHGLLYGVKTFCSGAGIIDRALVVVCDEHQARRLAYLDVTQPAVRVDRSWYEAPGLRSSESHRVEFDGAKPIAILGDSDELLREPYFSRDAIRTSATWVGLCEAVVEGAIDALRERPASSDLDALAAGRMCVAAQTAVLWLERAGSAAESNELSPAISIQARWAITEACREIIREAAECCGSRPLVTRTALSRARRDLDLFLLQHRLTPALARYGDAALQSE